MSYVAKTYEFVQKVRSLFNKKLFKVSFIAISSMVLFFGVMNAYAAETTDTKISPNWSGTQSFYNLASGTDASEVNVTSHSGQMGLNTAWVIFSTIAPEYTEGADEIESSTDVPADLKVGLLGFSDKAIAMVYDNQPSVNIAEHLQEEWVPGYKDSVTSTYAANTTSTSGYDTLMNSGIAPLWSQFRNIAYLCFVVVMIVIGFMIMFRSKIGGQMMVTLGNTIPSIIVSLVLVTFSFAIAGLIMDLGGFLISLLYYGIFDSKSIDINNLGQLFSIMFKGLGSQAVSVVKDSFSASISSLSTNIFSGLVAIFKSVLEFKGFGILALLGLIIGAGVVFVGAIKLIITLFKAYFELLLNVILGPLQIMIGTFPGQEAMRINWFTGIIRNVLVFPIVYFIVNIPIYLINIGSITFNLPASLTGAALGTSSVTTAVTSEGYIGLILIFVFRVFVLYYAAQAPKFAEAIIPVKETNRAAADAMANAKMSMSKIPLVGGLFGK